MKLRLVLIVGLGLTAAAAWAQEEPAAAPALFKSFAPKSGQPVEIHSDHLEIELAKRRVLFTGHVVAQQADRVIYADQVEVFYNEAGELLRLKARGNVKMTGEGALATGEELELDNTKGRLTLRGDPRVIQARQIIRGKEMVFLLKENRLEITEPRIEWLPAETPNGSKR
jgi:lipopolysaccharide transport protein LptA